MKVLVNCPQCEKEFETQTCWIKRGRGKFCSRSCTAKHRLANTGNYLKVALAKAIAENKITIGRPPTFVTIDCMYCNTPFTKKKSTILKTCSIECRKALRKKQLAYAYSKVDITKIMGENHYAWKGVNYDEIKRIREGVDYRKWRIAVMQRDFYTCQICGAKNKKGKKYIFHVDHIKSFAEYPELRLDLNNGRTLCKECHMKTPSWGRNIRKAS